MSLLKPPTPLPPAPPPTLPLTQSRELEMAEMDSDSEQERMGLDEEDTAIDVEADEEQEPGSPLNRSSSPPFSKSNLCLERNESSGRELMDITSPSATAVLDKSINQKVY
ncbi:hypothetical protein KR067_005116 [Drosophila pandora]|nr:hypothetical protein KR067_005116 [Drosophila pandora]